MVGGLKPCGACRRHVRESERACPFCAAPLGVGPGVAELRLLNRLDRGQLVALGAVLSAAGIALGCREQPVASVYGAPPTVMETPSAEPSATPAPTSSGTVLEPSPAPSSSAAAPPPTALKPSPSPTFTPVPAYGAPPRPTPDIAPVPPPTQRKPDGSS